MVEGGAKDGVREEGKGGEYRLIDEKCKIVKEAGIRKENEQEERRGRTQEYSKKGGNCGAEEESIVRAFSAASAAAATFGKPRLRLLSCDVRAWRLLPDADVHQRPR